VGIEVEQSAYSYGRPYAEDFVYWEFLIHNTGNSNLEDIYLGLYAKFRPDYDNHDYINLIDSDGDGEKDLIYVYDLNNERNKTWADTDAPLGMVGLRIYDTPERLGVTDFHHFARGVSPLIDEEIWAILTSDPANPHLKNPAYYFHGGDPHVDYTGLDSLASFYPAWLDEESHVELEGDGINYIVSCGPFTLEAGTSVPFSFGLIMGDAGTVPDLPDTTDLLNNVRLANTMYSLKFQGSGPPSPPTVEAIPGDGSALLYWTSEPAESSIDVLTEARDFEGYKIFRSTDQGLTWGSVVTDAHGIQVGYEPIATFDLDNSVEGLDPVFPQYLGTNSGLVHTYKDSNLVNGLEYWYCVTAYDRGNQHPDSLEPSYIYPLGASDLEPHTVAVIPGGPATDLSEAVVPMGSLNPIGGSCEGFARIEIIDPATITGHGYKITFSDTAILSIDNGDTTWGVGTTSFTLVDTTEMDTLFHKHTLSDESGDNLPVTDGFRLILQDSPSGVKSYGWTKVDGDTSTFDWRFRSIDPGLGAQLVQAAIHTLEDWRITIDTISTGGLEATWGDAFSGIVQDSTQHLPLRVHVITDPDNPIDVSEHTWLYEFAIPAPWEDYRKDYYSRLGWDLVPGGKAFTAGSPGWYEKHVDFLELVKPDIDPVSGDTSYSWIRMFTNHKPDTSFTRSGDMLIIDAKAPSDGDEFTVITYKPFRPSISYAFGTTAATTVEAGGDIDPLGEVRVVPDPYIVTNAWETSAFGKQLQFSNLPSECTIKIFTLVGEWVATVEHESDQNFEFWDMRNHNDQFIAPGVYLYAITTPGGDKALGRFLVIK
jgi:hypothetical protein